MDALSNGSYCTQCGALITDDSLFCPQCGAKVVSEDEKTVTSFPETNEINRDREDYRERSTHTILNDMTDKSKTYLKGGGINMTKAADTINEKAKELVAAGTKMVKPTYGSSSYAAQNGSSSTNAPHDSTVSGNELWTWLKKDSHRKKYYTDNGSTMDEWDFFKQHVQKKFNDNGVPARILEKEVTWDIGMEQESIFYLEPGIKVANPLTCKVQLSHVGKFTYVEEKVFITPPALPETPEKPKEVPAGLASRIKFVIWGVIALLIGAAITIASSNSYSYYEPSVNPLGAVACCVGAVFLIIGGVAYAELKNYQEHNEKCARQLAAWNKAWDEWENTIFLYSFQEDSNGGLSRIFDAAFECIKQVADHEFGNKDSKEEDDSTNLNELEELIARRREEYR